MAKLITFIVIFLILFSCVQYDDKEVDECSNISNIIVFTVSGTAPFISIDNSIYHGLFNGENYVKTSSYSRCYPAHPVITETHKIEKHTNDATIIIATIDVDGIQVVSQSTSDPYGVIIVSYTLP